MSSNAVEGIIEVLSNDALGLNHIFLVDKDGKQHQITNINILLTKQHPQGRCLYLNIEEIGESI
ncbi:MAG: hypothetical protein ACJ0F0_03045 [Burkholderiaceae bacterium]|tara:strand:+ start:171 stop:362 length:192 start_codon:yes stop_codon:yes gene_type:complete